ncbi:hypothetical protein [Amycolatopsis sp. NPDC004079]|uniref:hypothetical protein n=1 Tax=Amycolatopsis sp. NPDC004079 TaxID=3154549 RepID=UPI0033B6AC56
MRLLKMFSAGAVAAAAVLVAAPAAGTAAPAQPRAASHHCKVDLTLLNVKFEAQVPEIDGI